MEPTKKSYFNVTIKSNANNTSPPRQTPTPISSGFNPPMKLIAADNERDNDVKQKASYFQGISDWSERKDRHEPRNFATKAFREELKNTLEKKHKLIKQTSLPEVEKVNRIRETQNSYHNNRNGMRRPSREDSDDSRFIRVPKEDPGYMSGSRNDLRYRRSDSREELDRITKTNGHLRREDSGYVKDSREDLRHGIRNNRDDVYDLEKLRQQSIQRDDSAYVSSSTYLTTPNSPKPMRSQSPPIAPQRKRAIERKMRQQSMSKDDLYQKSHEPKPDYSPPSSPPLPPPQPHHIRHPRSRSGSPYQQQYVTTPLQNGNTSKHQHKFEKQQLESDQQNQKRQTLKKSSSPSRKVGTAIGNSLRKLVGKIRSASAERKIKMKSKQRSPSPLKSSHLTSNNNSTYQQYNIIDAHIGSHGQQIQTNGRHKQQPSQQKQQQQHHHHSNHNNDSRETSICDSIVSGSRRDRSQSQTIIDTRRDSSDVDMNPKQRYYLGEDPYGGSIYGRENKYEAARIQHQQQQQKPRRHHIYKTDEQEVYMPRYVKITFILFKKFHHHCVYVKMMQLKSK